MSASNSPLQVTHNLNADYAQGPPRKKMRKGTKSCIECRRRKIKCTFDSGRPSICNECHVRGSTCIDQEHGDISVFNTNSTTEQNASLKERVSYLEDLVKQVLHKMPQPDRAHTSSSTVHAETQAAEVLKSLKSPVRVASVTDESYLMPVGASNAEGTALALFDNSVITRKEVPVPMSQAQYDKSNQVIAALLTLLPSPEDVEIILDHSQEWCAVWKTMFPDLADTRTLTIKESISRYLRSEKPAQIAKIMLCIALSINQLPQDFDWSRVSIQESPSELTERYINTVDRLVTSDDEIAATVDGLECMILEAKYHINMGRPRRSWLLYHRAIAFGQLLGLHRLLLRRPREPDQQYLRQLMIWTHLIMGDRYLSLVLGLPYSIAEVFVKASIEEAARTAEASAPGEAFLTKMSPIMTNIIDRNQSPTPVPYQVTISIDSELDDLSRQPDSTWWTSTRLPQSTPEEHYDRLSAQFSFYHMKLLVHMPFMLRSSADQKYQFSHSAAIDAARNMVRYFEALRGNDDTMPHACKLLDFQAFTAAMLLLLNLCGYNSHIRGVVPQAPDLEQDRQDSALIDLAIQLLKKAARGPGGVVATQCASALEMLATVRTSVDCSRENCSGKTCQISIPYFGQITIGMGQNFVPIKPGTYPDAGAEKPRPAPNLTKRPRSPSSMRQLANNGLPTPPSLGSETSQTSPNESMMSQQRSPYGYPITAPGSGSLQTDNSWSPNDDPLVMFDSFMAFPGAQDIDFSGTSSTLSQNAMGLNDSTVYGTSLLQTPGPVYHGFGWSQQAQNVVSGFPFPMTGGAGLELDNGWEWSGIDNPVL